MAWHRCYHPLKVPGCVPCSTPPERLYCCRQVSLVEGDIFQSPFCVAHCVSSDQALRKGLAREIKRWYPLSWVTRAQDWSVGKVVTQIIDQNMPTERMIFHLVTKQRCWDKPQISDIEKCLNELILKMIRCGARHVSVPW